MATTTIRCNATAFTYIDSRYPDENFNTSGSVILNRYCTALMKFDTAPLQNYLKRYTTGYTIYAYKDSSNVITSRMYFLDESFDAGTVTYNDCYLKDTTRRWSTNKTGNANIMHGQYVPAEGGHRSLYDQMSIGIAIVFESGECTFSKNPLPYIEFVFDTYTKTFYDNSGIPHEEQYFNPTKYGNFYIELPGQLDYAFIQYPNVTSANIEYMLDTASTETTKSFTVNTPISGSMLPLSIPSNTFSKQKRYKWRGKYTIESNGETGWTPWYYFITTDSIPGPPQNLSPYASYLDGEKPITLSWEHNIATGSDQYAYDLDVLQGNTWENIVSHETTSTQNYVIAAGTLQSGNMQWRVRTYNIDDVSGEYAQSSISIVQTMPQAPTIISVSAYPTNINIKWQSAEQEAAEMQLLDGAGNLITGNFVYGSTKVWSHKSLLPDGSYTFRVRVQNGQGLWSDFAEQSIGITNEWYPPFIALYQPINGGMKISIGKSSPNYFYIIRNGEPIGKISSSGEFTDYRGGANDKYQVLEIVPPGYYAQSNVSNTPPAIKHAYLAYADSPESAVEIRYRVGGKPERSAQTSITVVEHYFLGRSLPCYDALGQVPCTWQFSYSFLRPDDDTIIEQIVGMLASGKPLLFRDWSGLKIYGVCTSYSENHISQYVDIKYSLSDCDYQDTIRY